MKIKKLSTALAVMPFGIAAASTAPYSAPHYGNVSMNDTATIDPSHWPLLIMPNAYLVPVTMPARPPRRRTTLRRIQQSIKSSLASRYVKMSYPPTGNSRASSPDRSLLPSVITTSTSWFGTSTKKKTLHRKQTSLGSVVQPGRVMSKEERKRRNDSVTTLEVPKSLEDQRTEDLSFRRFCQKIAWWDTTRNLNASLGENLAPEAAATVSWESRTGTRPHSARHLIVLLITFLLVFGSLYNLVTHLLNATRASAQCTQTTVMSTVTLPVIVTYTHTESIFVSPTACTPTSADVAAATMDSSSTSLVIHTSTSTSTLFSTKTLTVISAMSSDAPVSVSSTLPFVFSVVSGSTDWLNDVSPSSGASLTTATTTVFVTPIEQSSPTRTSSTTIQTTRTHTTTITPAADTLTSTSFISPDLTSTIHITRTNTVSSFVTSTRTSFGGIGSSGWNMTDSGDPTDTGTTTAAVITSTPTTATISFFWASSGGHTYSTSTKVITTTLYRTIAPEANSTTHSAPRSTRISSSINLSNGTGSVSANPRTPVTSNTNPSTFPTMNPGTDGIDPASGAATAPSGSAPSSLGSSSQEQSSEAQGITGVPTGATSAFPSNSSASGAAAISSEISPVAISDSSSLTQAPVTPTATSSVDNSTFSSQATSTVPTSNSTSSGNHGGVPYASSNASPSVLSTPLSVVSASPTASSVDVADITSGSSSVSSASLSSVTPSTDALFSIGSALANGPPTATTLNSSSVIPSSQTLASIGTTMADGQATASSSSSHLRSDTVTVPSVSSSASSTLTSSQYQTTSLSSPSMSTTEASLASSASNSTTSTASKTSASTSVSPAACGEHEDFVLNFDDLPSFSDDDDVTQAPPIFSPYHHLTFSNGYVHAPASKQPFAPHSGDQLAVFLAPSNGTNDTNWHQTGMSAVVPRTNPSEISDGPYDGLPAFWFNAQGAWLGCDNDGLEPCVFNVTGSTWDSKLGDDVETYNTQIELPACPNFKDCKLQHVDFPDNFRGLSGIQIQAFANNKPVMFFMDDLALSWYDNSCEAGMQRMGRPGSAGGPGHSSGGPSGGRKRLVRRTLMR